MKYVCEHTLGLILLAAWLVGIVVAKGFLSTLTAVCIPFYAWYLTTAWLLEKYT